MSEHLNVCSGMKMYVLEKMNTVIFVRVINERAWDQHVLP